MGKTYKDSERRGHDKRNQEQKRQQDRNRKKMNIDPGEFWDRKKRFKKNNVEEYDDD